MKQDDWIDLERCREEIERLAQENAHLRKSAAMFADLAERLNERRQQEDSRSAPESDRDSRPPAAGERDDSLPGGS